MRTVKYEQCGCTAVGPRGVKAPTVPGLCPKCVKRIRKDSAFLNSWANKQIKKQQP